MNFFSNDIMKGMMNMMSQNSSWGGSGGNEKENALRNNLERCTYPDETKWVIEKAAKQLFHVYPFFSPDILMFTENGQPRRYIELKGILEIDIKNKTCKVDYNMMLPFDYPRSPPFVRIVNRNPDYTVDPFYQSLKSKTDPSSYVLNDKLVSVKGWQPSSSLVNVVIECYDMFKNRFPFSKPVAEGNSGNAWDNLYNSKKGSTGTTNSNFIGGYNNPTNPPNNNWNANSNNGWGSSNPQWGNAPQNAGWGANNNNWGASNNNWGASNNNNWGGSNNAGWGGNTTTNTWGSNPPANNWNNPPANNAWGNNNSAWGGVSGGMGGMGGMSGIMSGGSNVTTSIASAQKLVGKQKQTLQQMNGQYLKLIEKVQVLDATKQSLESEESYLRTENFEMTNFLKQNESSASELSSITSIVQPKDVLSQQILDLLSGIKAREQCVLLLEAKFNQEQVSLEEFMKYLRRVEEAKFEEKILLQKCLKRAAA